MYFTRIQLLRIVEKLLGNCPLEYQDTDSIIKMIRPYDFKLLHTNQCQSSIFSESNVHNSIEATITFDFDKIQLPGEII